MTTQAPLHSPLRLKGKLMLVEMNVQSETPMTLDPISDSGSGRFVWFGSN